MNSYPRWPVGGSVARGNSTFARNRHQVLPGQRVHVHVRDERQGCSQGVRHQKECACAWVCSHWHAFQDGKWV